MVVFHCFSLFWVIFRHLNAALQCNSGRRRALKMLKQAEKSGTSFCRTLYAANTSWGPCKSGHGAGESWPTPESGGPIRENKMRSFWISPHALLHIPGLIRLYGVRQKDVARPKSLKGHGNPCETAKNTENAENPGLKRVAQSSEPRPSPALQLSGSPGTLPRNQTLALRACLTFLWVRTGAQQKHEIFAHLRHFARRSAQK